MPITEHDLQQIEAVNAAAPIDAQNPAVDELVQEVRRLNNEVAIWKRAFRAMLEVRDGEIAQLRTRLQRVQGQKYGGKSRDLRR